MPYELDPSWTPKTALYAERAWLLGYVFMGVAYGIVVVLAVLSLLSLHRSISASNRTRKLIMMAFVALVFSLTTLFFCGTVWMNLMAFVDYRLYPGGPSAFQIHQFALPIDAMATLSAVISSWLADALIVWRVVVVYSSESEFIWMKRGIPLILYITELSLGGLWMAQVSSASAWDLVHGANFTAPYFWFNLALHFAATGAIVGRLLFFRHRISSVESGLGSQYISIVAMIVESDALYSAFLLLFLIPFQTGHPLQGLFLQVFGTAHMIPSLLIVYRVASGTAWTNSTLSHTFTTSSVTTRPGEAPSDLVNMKVLSHHIRAKPLPVTFTCPNAELDVAPAPSTV